MTENTVLIQARTSAALKKDAADILDRLGLNLTTYINMALTQLIIQQGVPFEIKLDPFSFTQKEAIDEVKATMAMENMDLTDEEIRMLKAYRSGALSGDELRAHILNEVL